MRWKKLQVTLLAAVTAASLWLMAGDIQAEDGTVWYNRYNVMLVMDGSNSIRYTDPENLRVEAVKQFMGLLADSGNGVGGIVFSTDIEAQKELSYIGGAEDKVAVTDFFEQSQIYDFTNIGAALMRALDILGDGGVTGRPCAVILFSDGNTEMPDGEQLNTSLAQKAEAIQRARDLGIPIYSVCLNANDKADFSEMRQISAATGGRSEEVKSPEDLRNVFNDFYDLIYGTSTISLIDEVFPESGLIAKDFLIPGIGVEEVNIVVNGKTKSVSLIRPGGEPCSPENMTQVFSDTFLLIKLKDVTPGKWSIQTAGEPGDQIKVNMVYNTNLTVSMQMEPDGLSYEPDETVRVGSVLAAGNIVADHAWQYVGYEARLEILDANEQVTDTRKMEVSDRGFQTDYNFPSGASYARVTVEGYDLTKYSETTGPIMVAKKAPATGEKPGAGDNTEDVKEPENTAPTPVEAQVTKTVYIWPFKGGSCEVDLKSLAKDREDDVLTCKILSSSYLEGSDYRVEDQVLYQDHFSLSKGSYTIRAVDSGGLFCDIELRIVTYNVGLMALAGMAAAGGVALAVLGILLWIALTKPFGGNIVVQGYSEGHYTDKAERTPRRGRCKLSSFHLGNLGLNSSKCYFQATGRDYIEFVTNVPVYYGGSATRRIRIENGAEATVAVDQRNQQRIYIRFESRRNSMGPRRPKNGWRRRTFK